MTDDGVDFTVLELSSAETRTDPGDRVTLQAMGTAELWAIIDAAAALRPVLRDLTDTYPRETVIQGLRLAFFDYVASRPA